MGQLNGGLSFGNGFCGTDGPFENKNTEDGDRRQAQVKRNDEIRAQHLHKMAGNKPDEGIPCRSQASCDPVIDMNADVLELHGQRVDKRTGGCAGRRYQDKDHHDHAHGRADKQKQRRAGQGNERDQRDDVFERHTRAARQERNQSGQENGYGHPMAIVSPICVLLKFLDCRNTAVNPNNTEPAET